MFLMRRARTEDVATLLKLAKMVHFINLPADKDIIADKALWSRQCFLKAAQSRASAETERGVERPAASSRKPTGRSSKVKSAISAKSADASSRRVDPIRPGDRGAGPVHVGEDSGLASGVSRSDLFMFCLEDTESKGVLGTSQIIAQMGGPGRPNVSLRLSRKEMFSRSLQIGATHMVAKLHLDESGPTEIGGLILQPSYRGHKGKLGRFLSLVRFHFMGLYPEFFSQRVIAEMMAPITPDGRNTLWEYFGRRFINLSYTEADGFCQYSKEFITALFPREEIYLSLLPPEARAVVAQVGPETAPARRMLEKLGFAYKDLIDPFDGGPTLEVRTKDISIVRDTRRLPMLIAASEAELGAGSQIAMVSTLDADGEFRAVQAPVRLTRDGVQLPSPAAELLEVEPGAMLGITPLGEATSADVPTSGARSAPAKPARARAG
jgi:arginine N-succinyltransferase